mmetsp:Transcript_46102/g.97831  ORF Transcript_46102/g.97831 Transcript_46102/m.97831 type:complete len:170 (+) Transcript_46102:271-780(+)
MTRSLDTVFDNARCHEDKLDSTSVLVQSLLVDDKPKVALDRSSEVLRHIGEPVPEDLDGKAIRKEIIEIYKCVHRISPASLNVIPLMADRLKIKAMHFLNLSLWSTSHQKSMLFAIVSCRMVRLTITHGKYPEMGRNKCLICFHNLRHVIRLSVFKESPRSSTQSGLNF